MPPLPNKEAVGQHPPLWQRRRNWWGWQLRLHRGEEQRRWRTAKRWRSPLMPPLPNKEAVGQHPPLWQRRKNRWGWQLRLHRGEEQSANEGRKEVRKTTENTIFWWRNIASLMTHAFPWKAQGPTTFGSDYWRLKFHHELMHIWPLNLKPWSW